MNLLLHLTIRIFTTWILTALLNGLFYGTYVSLNDITYTPWMGNIIITILLSLFFAAPGFSIFWIIMVAKLRSHVYERALFRAALSTGFILATATAIICLQVSDLKYPENYIISISIILSAETSIMLHFRSFKNIRPKQNQPQQSTGILIQ